MGTLRHRRHAATIDAAGRARQAADYEHALALRQRAPGGTSPGAGPRASPPIASHRSAPCSVPQRERRPLSRTSCRSGVQNPGRPATLEAVHLPDVLALARSLMATHGLEDWELDLDRARRRAGQTDHARRRITLSRHLMRLYDEAEVRETILHEIAHARVGASHGHDAVWRAEARRIGSTGRRLVDPHAPRVEGRWRGTCPAGHTVTRMRRPSVPLACAVCARSFRVENLLEWQHDGATVTPEEIGPRYARTLAALQSR